MTNLQNHKRKRLLREKERHKNYFTKINLKNTDTTFEIQNQATEIIEKTKRTLLRSFLITSEHML